MTARRWSDYSKTMSKTILLVDDDKYIRDVNEEVLREAGYEVVVAENGKEAYDLLMVNEYDLVFLDVIMPLLDGIGVLQKLQETPPKHQPQNIYFLTNLANDPAVKEAFALGAKECLTKSDITPDKLVEVARRVIGNGGGGL